MYYKIVYIILLYCLSLLPFTAQAQKTGKAAALCEKAKTAINAHDFDKAYSLLTQARSKDPLYPDTYILLGDLYNFTLRSDSAEACYNRAIDLIGNPDPLLYYIAATEGAKCGHYESALGNYEIFMQRGLQYTDVLTDAQKGIANCRFAIEAMKHPVPFQLKNLAASIRSGMSRWRCLRRTMRGWCSR